MLKEVWQFLHDEGHINQGILEDEPESQVAGMSLVGSSSLLEYLHWQSLVWLSSLLPTC